ncbi:MAG: D-2-hydroxyacid dehydrogenase [Betaproteobacteria bacterium]|nr:D-2-hydroxyacid dehydrogenase [Betaproteobacteria bacterium]
MTKPVCVFWMNEAKVFEQALAQAGLTQHFEVHSFAPEQAVPEAVAARAEVLVGWRAHGAFAGMPKLRYLQAMTAGVDHWLASPHVRPDITLCCARGSHRIPMPENILGAVFHLTKPYMAAALDQRQSKWARKQGVQISGKTLGILGLGAIGQEVARKAAALEMRVIGTKRRPKPLPHVTKVYPQEATGEVLAASDFVLLLLPVTADTENLINAQRLATMKPTAYLLNFARGALIVDADLIAAVRAKTIAGAVLDVFREEPLPSTHPFWQTEGILVLPHIGGGHPKRSEAVAEVFVENARRFLANQPLQAVVDRVAGY